MVNKAAQALGRLGGIKSSEAKKRAARRNAKRGGRPGQFLADELEATLYRDRAPEETTIAIGVRIQDVRRVGRRWIFRVTFDDRMTWQRGYSNLKPKIRTE